ncbi:hypothetical protein SFRURICE_011482 [Spodoptera frugiperda]|nr:hypothetical protein SFRURICE_011482 [Spodoptera frugiperda]
MNTSLNESSVQDTITKYKQTLQLVYLNFVTYICIRDFSTAKYHDDVNRYFCFEPESRETTRSSAAPSKASALFGHICGGLMGLYSLSSTHLLFSPSTVVEVQRASSRTSSYYNANNMRKSIKITATQTLGKVATGFITVSIFELNTHKESVREPCFGMNGPARPALYHGLQKNDIPQHNY